MEQKTTAALSTFLSTPEGRKKLAASMVRPFRCGGSGYDQGRYYVIAGGFKVYKDSEEYRNLMARHYG